MSFPGSLKGRKQNMLPLSKLQGAKRQKPKYNTCVIFIKHAFLGFLPLEVQEKGNQKKLDLLSPQRR